MCAEEDPQRDFGMDENGHEATEHWAPTLRQLPELTRYQTLLPQDDVFERPRWGLNVQCAETRLCVVEIRFLDEVITFVNEAKTENRGRQSGALCPEGGVKRKGELVAVSKMVVRYRGFRLAWNRKRHTRYCRLGLLVLDGGVVAVASAFQVPVQHVLQGALLSGLTAFACAAGSLTTSQALENCQKNLAPIPNAPPPPSSSTERLASSRLPRATLHPIKCWPRSVVQRRKKSASHLTHLRGLCSSGMTSRLRKRLRKATCRSIMKARYWSRCVLPPGTKDCGKKTDGSRSACHGRGRHSRTQALRRHDDGQYCLLDVPDLPGELAHCQKPCRQCYVDRTVSRGPLSQRGRLDRTNRSHRSTRVSRSRLHPHLRHHG